MNSARKFSFRLTKNLLAARRTQNIQRSPYMCITIFAGRKCKYSTDIPVFTFILTQHRTTVYPFFCTKLQKTLAKNPFMVYHTVSDKNT